MMRRFSNRVLFAVPPASAKSRLDPAEVAALRGLLWPHFASPQNFLFGEARLETARQMVGNVDPRSDPLGSPQKRQAFV